MFKTAILSCAEEVCGRKRLGVSMNSEKKTSWWNKEVKEAVQAKKEAYKAWLHDKSSVPLHLRYTKARKAAAQTVKLSKEKTWKDFGEKLESDYRSANKVFWQTIRRLRGRKPTAAVPIRDNKGVLLTNKEDILARWKEYFEGLLNPVSCATADTQHIHFEEEITLSEVEIAQAIKSLKAGKAAAVMKSDLRC